MSDLGFDVRGYCERLAACSDRFHVGTSLFKGDTVYSLHDAKNPDSWVALWSSPRPLAMDLSAFFLPLADERKIEDIRPWDIVTKRSDHRFPTLLEEIIAAVVESFESEVKA